MNDSKITFFMIVTDPDVIIADYAVRSYGKIKKLKFKLEVYSNWVSSPLKQKYFPRWRKFEFVEILENKWQTEANKPTNPEALQSRIPLQGPFERCETIWDRELRKIQTPYHATVDADFEILDPKFIEIMLAELDANSKLIAMSTDFFPKQPEYYDSFSNDVICLNERWPTWFCIYKQEALRCDVSHLYYEEISSGTVRRNAWDSSGYFQKALRDIYGFQITALDCKYQPFFIHYGGFSKNRHISEANVALYRRLQILKKRGLLGRKDVFTRTAAICLNKSLFGNVDRSKYLEGWGKR